MQAASQAILGVLAKVVVDKAVNAFGISNCSVAWAEPCVSAAYVIGFLFFMSGMILQEKKPGLSKVMLKIGAVAIAFALLVPMAVSLPPVMALAFGLLTAFIVVLTAALG